MDTELELLSQNWQHTYYTLVSQTVDVSQSRTRPLDIDLNYQNHITILVADESKGVPCLITSLPHFPPILQEARLWDRVHSPSLSPTQLLPQPSCTSCQEKRCGVF